MRPIIKLALACAAFVQQAALGETLRCGAVLIQPGDDARYVLEKCGDPADSARLLTDPGFTEAINVYRIGVMRADRWRYHRGPGLFPAVLTIADDGRVQDIEFERVRD